MSKYTLISFSVFVFILHSFANYWLYQHTLSPLGNILYFLGIPILILFYITEYFIFYGLFQQSFKQQFSLSAIAFFKATELSFYLMLISFTLVSYLLIGMIITLKLSLLTTIFILNKKNQSLQNIITPYYDLILLGILSLFLAYIPHLHQQYPVLSIGIINLLINSILILIIISLLLQIYPIYRSIFQTSKLIGDSETIL